MKTLITVLTFIVSAPVMGQFFNKKLTGADAGKNGRNEWDYFGRSVAISESLFLPFEGDAGLSIILSKAFLLADDDKITDTTITSKINRK